MLNFSQIHPSQKKPPLTHLTKKTPSFSPYTHHFPAKGTLTIPQAPRHGRRLPIPHSPNSPFPIPNSKFQIPSSIFHLPSSIFHLPSSSSISIFYLLPPQADSFLPPLRTALITLNLDAHTNTLVEETNSAILGAMSPYTELDKTSLPDGSLLALYKQDEEFILEYNGLELMSTNLTWSEQMLADLGCVDLLEGATNRPEHPRVLIGGLGMGFTLKRVLELVGSPATVDVAELMSQVIEWNRTYLVEHNGPLLDDPRTNVILADLFDCLGDGDTYDAILIDIDDTPDAVITAGQCKALHAKFSGIAAGLAQSGRLSGLLDGCAIAKTRDGAQKSWLPFDGASCQTP